MSCTSAGREANDICPETLNAVVVRQCSLAGVLFIPRVSHLTASFPGASQLPLFFLGRPADRSELSQYDSLSHPTWVSEEVLPPSKVIGLSSPLLGVDTEKGEKADQVYPVTRRPDGAVGTRQTCQFLGSAAVPAGSEAFTSTCR